MMFESIKIRALLLTYKQYVSDWCLNYIQQYMKNCVLGFCLQLLRGSVLFSQKPIVLNCNGGIHFISTWKFKIRHGATGWHKEIPSVIRKLKYNGIITSWNLKICFPYTNAMSLSDGWYGFKARTFWNYQ